MNLNRIYEGDCYELIKEIPDGSIDMILTDPPYASTNCKWDNPINIPLMFEGFWRVLKKNGAIAIFSQLPFGCDLINASRKEFRYEWIWEKSNAVGYLNAKKMPLRAHENILIFYRQLPTYNPQMWKSKPYRTDHSNNCPEHLPKINRLLTISNGERYPIDRIQFKREPSNHPTAKPVQLLEYLIRTYTNEGDLILDPFAGSASTAVAALKSNRSFICMEKETKYVEVGNRRIAEEIQSPKQIALAI